MTHPPIVERLPRRVRQTIVSWFVGLLTKPLKNYAFRFPNDLGALRRHLQKGDVLLVEGSQRISEAVKYLTQSSWSHSALYIGDELARRNHPLAAQAREEFGDEADCLLVEALAAKGVVMSPLSKYAEHNVRICHPHNLQAADRQVLLDEVIDQLGYTYDLKNIFDLARYFLPFSLVPRRFRHTALRIGSGEPTRVICSSMIASAFVKVGFPILPRVETAPDAEPPPFYQRLLSFVAPEEDARPVFHRRHPTLITPRDFDLSPYFETVKFNVIGSRRLDYRNVVWAEDLDGRAAAHSVRPA